MTQMVSQKGAIDREAKRRVEEYEEKIKKEEEEERKRIKAKKDQVLSELKRKDKEFEEATTKLNNELESAKKLAAQMLELQHEENRKIENAISTFMEQISEKVKATLSLISNHVKKLDKFSSALGYAVDAIGAIPKLLSMKKQLMADARLKNGRQLFARRAKAERSIDSAMEIGQEIEEATEIIDSFQQR